MKFDKEYLEVKHSLMTVFLLSARPEVLDISYTVKESRLSIQVVLLEGHNLSKKTLQKMKDLLSHYTVEVKELYMTREKFNEALCEWKPKHYHWLDFLLFSKAEVL